MRPGVATWALKHRQGLLSLACESGRAKTGNGDGSTRMQGKRTAARGTPCVAKRPAGTACARHTAPTSTGPRHVDSAARGQRPQARTPRHASRAGLDAAATHPIRAAGAGQPHCIHTRHSHADTNHTPQTTRRQHHSTRFQITRPRASSCTGLQACSKAQRCKRTRAQHPSTRTPSALRAGILELTDAE